VISAGVPLRAFVYSSPSIMGTFGSQVIANMSQDVFFTIGTVEFYCDISSVRTSVINITTNL